MIFLNDDDVFKLADPADLIAELGRAFASPGDQPKRLHCDLPGKDGAKLLVMPAWLDRDAIGVKVATVMPGNGGLGRPTIGGLYVLLDGKVGEPRAIISAAALTAVRTAAVSGLACQQLARRDARTLLIIGTGALAPHMARAHAAVRSFDRVLVWGRDSAKARAVADQLEDSIPSIDVSVDLAAAISQADVISAATASRAPLILGEQVKPGTHVDLVGSFTPDMREADSELFSRGRVVVDTPRAFEESGDLLTPAMEGVIRPEAATSLSDLVREPVFRRRDDREITIFKSVGTGLADIAAAARIENLHRRGREIDDAQPEAGSPKLPKIFF